MKRFNPWPRKHQEEMMRVRDKRERWSWLQRKGCGSRLTGEMGGLQVQGRKWEGPASPALLCGRQDRFFPGLGILLGLLSGIHVALCLLQPGPSPTQLLTHTLLSLVSLAAIQVTRPRNKRWPFLSCLLHLARAPSSLGWFLALPPTLTPQSRSLLLFQKQRDCTCYGFCPQLSC